MPLSGVEAEGEMRWRRWCLHGPQQAVQVPLKFTCDPAEINTLGWHQGGRESGRNLGKRALKRVGGTLKRLGGKMLPPSPRNQAQDCPLESPTHVGGL